MANDNNEFCFTLNKLIDSIKECLDYPLYINNKKVIGWDVQCSDRTEPFVSIHFFTDDKLKKGYYEITKEENKNAE